MLKRLLSTLIIAAAVVPLAPIHANMINGSMSLSTVVAPNSVALGTDTTGNYVATVVASGSGISTSGASTGEGIAHTLTLDLTYAPTWTGTHTFTPSGTNDLTVNVDADSLFTVSDGTKTLTIAPDTLTSANNDTTLFIKSEAGATIDLDSDNDSASGSFQIRVDNTTLVWNTSANGSTQVGNRADLIGISVENDNASGASLSGWYNFADTNDRWWSAGRDGDGHFSIRYNDTVAGNPGSLEYFGIDRNANFGFHTTSVGTSATNTIVLASGTAPASAPADVIQLTSYDFAVGDARLNLLTEQGGVLTFGNNAIRNPNSDGTFLLASEKNIIANIDSDNDGSDGLFTVNANTATVVFSVAEDGTSYSTGTFQGNTGISVGSTGHYNLTANGSGPKYIALLNSDQNYAGKIILQAGGGSSNFGGAINLYGHSNATHPGDVAVGLSSGSTGKFRVNQSGIDDSASTFIVDGIGNQWQNVVTSKTACTSAIPGAYTTYRKGTAGTEATSRCVCEEVAGVYGWVAVTVTGDCT